METGRKKKILSMRIWNHVMSYDWKKLRSIPFETISIFYVLFSGKSPEKIKQPIESLDFVIAQQRKYKIKTKKI